MQAIQPTLSTNLHSVDARQIEKGKGLLKNLASSCEGIFLTQAALFVTRIIGGYFLVSAIILGTGLYHLKKRVEEAVASEGGLKNIFNKPLTNSEKNTLYFIANLTGLNLICNSLFLIGGASFYLNSKPMLDAVSRVYTVCALPQYRSITNRVSTIDALRILFNIAKHTSAAFFDPKGSLKLQDTDFALPEKKFAGSMLANMAPSVGEFLEKSIFDGFLTALPNKRPKNQKQPKKSGDPTETSVTPGDNATKKRWWRPQKSGPTETSVTPGDNPTKKRWWRPQKSGDPTETSVTFDALVTKLKFRKQKDKITAS